MRLTLVETGLKFMTHQTSNSLSNITHKRLSVQISLTGLSFLISDGHTKSPLEFKHVSFDTPQTPESLLQHLKTTLADSYYSDFESVDVLYSNGEYTVVPASLFDEKKASDYLKFNNKILSNDFIAFDHIDSSDLCVVYIPLVNINNYLFDLFGTFKYYHSTTVLLDKARNHSSLKDEIQVQVHVLSDRFDMIVWKKDRLLMCNSYPHTSPEDFIYYILFGFEQLELDPDSTPVTLMGEITESNSLYEIAYKYIRNIEFLRTDAQYENIEELKGHSFPALKQV